MRNTNTRVIPIVIGAIEAEFLHTEYLALIRIMTRKGDSTQQTAMLG